MSIKFICPQCRKVLTVKDQQSGVKAKCPCGAILLIPLKTSITNENFVAVEGRKNFILESFIAVLIGSSAIIFIISFIGGAILSKTDPAMITSRIKQIEKDTYQIKSETEQLKTQIMQFCSEMPQTDTTPKQKKYGIDFSHIYFQSDGSFKQIKEIAAQLRYRMESDRSWTTDDLLNQFSYESGFAVSKLKVAMDSILFEGKIKGQNWNDYEALLLAGLFLENESHATPKY